VLFNPAADTADRQVTLFLRPLDPEADRWDGRREMIGADLRQRTGFKTVLRSNMLPRALTAAARRAKRLACLHALGVYPAGVSPDLAAFKQVSERVPGVKVEDRSELLPALRAVKSPAELRLMRRAVEATEAGYAAAFKVTRPGAGEGEIARAIESAFHDRGAEGSAYNPIVGTGANGTILHYMANAAPVEAGDLIVIDAGASFAGYAADVTRTLPASGRFTAEQREVYEVVLRAQRAAIAAVRPGAKMSDVDEAARVVIEKAGYGDAFVHSIGHPLGLEVHDVTPEGPLRAGMVVTVEPGVYLQERKLGVRIEDDILITAKGNQNLTARIPKTVEEVEEAMGSR